MGEREESHATRKAGISKLSIIGRLSKRAGHEDPVATRSIGAAEGAFSTCRVTSRSQSEREFAV
jgi:hypothetical protein